MAAEKQYNVRFSDENKEYLINTIAPYYGVKRKIAPAIKAMIIAHKALHPNVKK